MAPDPSLRKRVTVESKDACFVVLVDAQPVLRCAAHRDALRYAVIVRRALERARSYGADGTFRSRRRSPAVKHRISPGARHIHH